MQAVSYRFDRIALCDFCQILNGPAFNQIDQSRQAQSIRQLQQIQTFVGCYFRYFVGVQIAKQLVEWILGDARKYDLWTNK